jgi:hypothetical protein
MGNKTAHLCARARPVVFELHFRIHRLPQCAVLHLESDSPARSDRDDVMVRFLD